MGFLLKGLWDITSTAITNPDKLVGAVGGALGGTAQKVLQVATDVKNIALGAGAAIIAAPYVVAAAPKVASIVSSKLVSSAVAHPIQTATAVLVGAPLVAGVVSKKPSLLTSLPKDSFNAGADLVSTIENHPTATALIGSVTGGALAYDAYKYLTSSDTSNATTTVFDGVPVGNNGLSGNADTPTATANNSSPVGNNGLLGNADTPTATANNDMNGSNPVIGTSSPTGVQTETAKKTIAKSKHKKRRTVSSAASVRVTNNNFIKVANVNKEW